MPDIVVFGTELDRSEAEMVKTVIELARNGNSTLSEMLIEKMGRLRHNEGLAVIARVLGNEGHASLAEKAIESMK